MNGSTMWSVVYPASVAAAVLVRLLPTPVSLRAVVMLWFLAVCPGMILVRRLRLADGVTQFTVTVAVSVAVDTLMVTGLLYAGVRSSDYLFAFLAAACGIDVIFMVTRKTFLRSTLAHSHVYRAAPELERS